MSTKSNIYASSTFQAFCAIEQGDYREKIRFCAINRREINNLPLEEYVRVLSSYGEALFETGRYVKHLRVADELIELSITHNIVEVDDRDLYFDTLFQKAASYYNIRSTDKAIHILRELAGMQPENESVRLFLINCYIRTGSAKLTNLRKWSVIMILASAGIIAFELLIVRPFLPEATGAVEATRNSLFLGGAVVLLSGEAWVRYKAIRQSITGRV